MVCARLLQKVEAAVAKFTDFTTYLISACGDEKDEIARDIFISLHFADVI